MQKEKKNLGKFYKVIFGTFFLLFTASVRSRPPGPPADPGVLHQVSSVLASFGLLAVSLSEVLLEVFS